jgi:glycosyltransferase involved in cell wall biosynthesis
MSKISIVTPTYNRSNVLPRAIESVLQQTFQDYEYIVVDDGSTDNTREVVADYNDERINYIKLDCNKGFATALNRGIKTAEGEFISFLDSDDEYLRTRLEKTNRILEDRSDRIGGVFHSYKVIGENGESEHLVSDGVFRLADFMEKNIIRGTSNTMYRSSVFEQVGDFDEQLPSTVDYDFQLRVLEEFKLVGINEILSRKYNLKERIQNDPGKVRKGLEQFIEKHKNNISKENLLIRKVRIGNTYLETNDIARGRKYLENIIQDSSLESESYARYVIGRECLRNNHKKEAQRHLKKSLRLDLLVYKPYILYIASLLPIDGSRSYEMIRDSYTKLLR